MPENGNDVAQNIHTHVFQVLLVQVQQHVHSDSILVKNVGVIGCI